MSDSYNNLYKKQRRFTLTQILVTIVIISILAGVSTPSYFIIVNRARESGTKEEMRDIATALEIYNTYDNYYPTTKQGLNELINKGYVKNLSTYDLWDNPYSYISDGIKYTLQSNGVDKESGTDDDIVFENGVMTAIGSYGGNDNSISLSSDIKNEEGS
jgi:general secretion pathway protein G